VAGTAIAISGVIVAWLNLIAGLMLVLAGGTAAGWVLLGMRRGVPHRQPGVLLPVHPKVNDLSLLEMLRAAITLGPDGKYETSLEPVDGELAMTFVFGRPDRERLQNLQRKHPRAQNQDARFTAGRLVLPGPARLAEGPNFPGRLIPLEGNIGDFPVFRKEDPHVSSFWTRKLTYKLAADPDIEAGPVWITPSVVPESDQRALELDIQWVRFGPPDEPLSLDVIDLLELKFPVGWGNVEQVSEQAILRRLPEEDADGQHFVRSIEWKQLSPTEHQRGVQRLTLAIRFEQQISLEDVVCGRLEATMKGTLSGITGVRLYGALGARRRDWRSSAARTRIEADFTLSLASIRYQAIRIVPDRAAREGGGSSYADQFDAIPDDEAIIDLTNAMSEQGYYVKRIIENPPRSGARADRVHRYWDIAGRRYEGVYPIDFHVVLTGEEVHRGGIRPEEGTTKARIVVTGAYTDPRMSDRIEEEWKTLRDVTAEVLSARESADRQSARTSAWENPNQQQPPRSKTASSQTRPGSASHRLQRWLSKLDEALIDGRISHEQYAEMRERAENELGDD
jgi:hypothetical protein